MRNKRNGKGIEKRKEGWKKGRKKLEEDKKVEKRSGKKK